MLGHYFWHVQIRIHRQNVCFVFFRIYCLDVIKMSKLLTREMSRAPVNNCFCRIRLFSSKNDNLRVYGVGIDRGFACE